MASSLFGNTPQNQPNNMIQMIRQFNEFRNSLNGQNPEQIVRNLIQSGKMSQEQFKQLSEAANSLQQFLK